MATTDIEKNILSATKVKVKKGMDKQEYYKLLGTAAQELKEDEWEGMSEEAQVYCNVVVKAVQDGSTIPAPNDEFKKEDDYEAEDGEETGEETGEEANAADEDVDSGTDSDDNEPSDDDGGDDSDASDDEPGDEVEDGDDEEPKPRTRSRKKASADDDEEDEDEPKKKATTKMKAPSKKAEKAPKKTAAKADKVAKPTTKKATKEEKAPRVRDTGSQATIRRLVIEDPKRTTDDIEKIIRKKGFTTTRLSISTLRVGALQMIRLIQEAGYLKNLKV